MRKRKVAEQTPRQWVEETLRVANHMGTLMREPEALLCVVADAAAARERANALPPVPECKEDEQILLLLGESAYRYWVTPEKFDWHGAQLASWSIPVACCVRCREEVNASGSLASRHTSHSKCFPEAWRERPSGVEG